MNYILSYDIGTTGLKTCLYFLGEALELKGTTMEKYPLHILPGGGAEQDPEDWWQAMIRGTAEILRKTQIRPTQIEGISFCSQMQGLILVDASGRPLRRAFSYLDGRAVEQHRRGLEQGLKIAGMNLRKLIYSLVITGGISASVKDPLWKYHWVREQEPDIFKKIHKWLDVKDYLVFRCTGRFVMTGDSANVTFLYDTRKGKTGWSRGLLHLFGVQPEHLPEVIPSTAIAGTLTPRAAAELGLAAGTPVNGGGGDLTCITLGAGCIKPGNTHIYLGTSGWVASVVAKRHVDIYTKMASIIGVRAGLYNYIGEQETAGKCLEWARDNLAYDEIGIFSSKTGSEKNSDYPGAFKAAITRAKPGCQGVIFTPWLHGNRSPFEDPLARGMFFNLSLDTGKAEMLRAVEEGIGYHKRWLLECMMRKIPLGNTLRFAGGGVNDLTAQILADITGKKIEAVALPQHAGAAGAALLCSMALKKIEGSGQAGGYIPIRKVFTPDPTNREVYERNYRVFKRLYGSNRQNFRLLNEKKH